jgi:imidazolonepropionase-like amidohydrolase
MLDDADEVRLAVREQLMQGASQIKLAAGGGVFSNFDPIDVVWRDIATRSFAPR